MEQAPDESVAEQSGQQFEVGDWPAPGTLLGVAPSASDREGPIRITNEFADVVITRVRTRNGERLDIWSPRRGTRVQLDAVMLDCLSMQKSETFTELLQKVT